MLVLLLWISAFIFFTSIGVLILNRVYKDRLVMERRLSLLITERSESEQTGQESMEEKSLYTRLIQPAIVKIRKAAVDKLPKQKMKHIEKRLEAAGYPFGMSASDFILIQTLLPIVLFVLFIIFFIPATDQYVKVFILASISATFAYSYTNYYIVAKIKQRTKLIDKSMPDFFDMLNVSIEAGLGLDGALKKVCHQLDTPISHEFLSALEDMKLGKPRKQAFIELRERVPSDFFKSVMSSIIQADQMGIGMSKVLKTQTQRIREKQRFSAKEQALKAPVKMLIPMILFIFPTLFIVLIGPVIVNLITQFL